MQIYLAGGGCYVKDKTYWLNQKEEFYKRINILESFYYIEDWQIELIHKFKNFMLDSGAFTFMQNRNINTNFEEYSKKYADFIKLNNIDLFFEMDIDLIVGYKEVKRLRSLIENRTQKLPIWVMQQGRTFNDFKDALKKYNYFAIPLSGASAYSKNRKKMIAEINYLCDIVHKEGKKIHGLGFTKVNLKDYRFDSVDSTAWTYGNRGKFIYEFNGETMITHSLMYKNNKIKAKETAIHNFMEWVKWSEHLERTKQTI